MTGWHVGDETLRRYVERTDSAAEGVNLVGDKAFTEELPLPAAEEAAAEAAPVEEVDLEAALGGGIRKAPAVVAALDEAEVAEGAH